MLLSRFNVLIIVTAVAAVDVLDTSLDIAEAVVAVASKPVLYLLATRTIANGIVGLVTPDSCKPLSESPTHVLDFSEWMMDVPGHLTLYDITLPGTHDSASFSLHKEVNTHDPEWKKLKHIPRVTGPRGLNSVLCRLAQTQAKGFAEQLKGGMRYFDLRVDFDGSDYRFHHLLFGDLVLDHLHEFREFMEQNPSEIIVIEISHMYNQQEPSDPVKLRFQNDLVSAFGELLYKKRSSGRIESTIEEMRNTNQRIVLTVEDDFIAKHPLIWPESLLKNTFPKTAKISEIFEYNLQQMEKFSHRNPKQLFKISWTATFDAKWFVKNLRSDMFDSAAATNQKLPDFFSGADDATEPFTQYGNILLVDFFETGELMDHIHEFYPLI